MPMGSRECHRGFSRSIINIPWCADDATPSLQVMHPVYPLISRGIPRGETHRTLGESKSFSVCLSIWRNEIQSVKFVEVHTIWLNAASCFLADNICGIGGVVCQSFSTRETGEPHISSPAKAHDVFNMEAAIPGDWAMLGRSADWPPDTPVW